MRSLDWTNSATLAEWVEEECQHLDLIASWETLLSVYQALGFQGPDSDEVRLAEFKQVITELNKFLTRMKNGLSKARDHEAAIEFLAQHVETADMSQVRTRANIAYNKLKQRWVAQSISVLVNAVQMNEAQAEALEGERDVEQWT